MLSLLVGTLHASSDLDAARKAFNQADAAYDKNPSEANATKWIRTETILLDLIALTKQHEKVGEIKRRCRRLSLDAKDASRMKQDLARLIQQHQQVQRDIRARSSCGLPCLPLLRSHQRELEKIELQCTQLEANRDRLRKQQLAEKKKQQLAEKNSGK